MALNVPPIRPFMFFVNEGNQLTKEAYDFLYSMFIKVGGSLAGLDATTLLGFTWNEPPPIGAITANTGRFTTITSTIPLGTPPFTVASQTKVTNLNVDYLDGNDWANPASLGSVTPNAGAFTSVTYSGQLTSTVTTGTAPLVVTSTTKVSNLNVDLLDGADWVSPGTIGSTTPNSAVFTALSTNGTANANLGTDSTNSTVNFRGSNTGAGGGTAWAIRNNGTSILTVGNKSAVLGTAYDARPYFQCLTQPEFNLTLLVPGGAAFIQTTSALNNGAGAGAGTITNAPAAGNPTKWIPINDNGTVRYIPAW